MSNSKIPDIVKRHEQELLVAWMEEQKANLRQKSMIKEAQLRTECTNFLRLLQSASSSQNIENIEGSEWNEIREMLSEVSRGRSLQGFSPSETATFVFSFKKPFFERLQKEFAQDAATLANETWRASELIDKLGLYTTEVYQQSREEVISQQQQEMLELSTPVVKLWEGILTVPLIGTLDSNRTQVVMENLLQKIVSEGAEVAIMDITGVPTVDTLVAQHLIKTVTAARLMGADCIISGIRPQIAQTIVHLGVDLGNIITKATLAEAFKFALQRIGMSVGRSSTQK
jgi:rsbT co-antagonist protein RsbR